MKHKKLLALFLGGLLGCSVMACSTPGGQSPSDSVEKDSSQESSSQKEDPDSQENENERTDSQEPILDADATDEELLELVKEDTHVVKEEEFEQTVKDMKEHMEEFQGQLYQMEGYYIEKDEAAYLADSPKEEKEENLLPLQYVLNAPEEGSKVRITGVAEESEEGGMAFSVVVLEPLD